MNDPASHQPAPHDPLAVLRGQFPGWEAWRGVSGLLYVRRRMSSPPVVFRAYSAEALAEQIGEYETRRTVTAPGGHPRNDDQDGA